MDSKKLDLSAKELCKTKRRVEKLVAEEKQYLSFLERSSDECWAYPDANEKYESYLDRMGKAEERIEELNNAIVEINEVIIKLASLKQE